MHPELLLSMCVCAAKFAAEQIELCYYYWGCAPNLKACVLWELAQYNMDEILTYEQLKDHFVKMCEEAKEDFADSSNELKDF